MLVELNAMGHHLLSAKAMVIDSVPFWLQLVLFYAAVVLFEILSYEHQHNMSFAYDLVMSLVSWWLSFVVFLVS